ncbi:MAG: DUF3524 domain-containing protein [Chloroflexi bacterium]|nr:MAG: DUF3524 domain-containing protein [Chloroflexota bacterium]
MDILLLEPYFTGSHADWATGYAKHSRHRVEVLSLPGRFWKWRMHGGAVSLARQFLASSLRPDLILATDMLDLTTFLALTRRRSANIPTAIYFHENQLTYPWSPTDRDVSRRRDKHYGFINFTSALAADAVFFNSAYHRQSFLAELPRLLKHFPDYNELASVEQITAKSRVLPLGLNLARFDPHRTEKNAVPLILWNHRWEYDKNPDEFFAALLELARRGLAFEVALLGENFSRQPEVFLQAQQSLGARVVQFGYAENFADYARWLWQAALLPVTSNQDFFGASVLQAMYCDVIPLLPQRLAYPEHIPPADHPHYFYQNFDDLVARLVEAVEQFPVKQQKSLRPVAEKYNWHRLVQQYDDVFAGVVSS